MDKASRQKHRKWILTAILVAGNVIPWIALPKLAYDVTYQVAMQRHILLGYYREGHLTSLLGVLLISVPVLVLIWTKPENLKRRRLQLLALVVSVMLAAFLFDLALRIMSGSSYVLGGNIITHRANSEFRGITRDVPRTAFSFPAIQPGYEDVPYVLTNDARGFRNQVALSDCEILAVGDSFVEGSEVSDEQVWPLLLGKRTGKSVYNLGIGNGSPFTYLATLKEIGLQLKPKTVLLMIYEGNDFRHSKPRKRSGLRYRLHSYRKRSPLIRAIKRAMIKVLGPVGAKRITNVPEDHRLWPVAWLPLALPEGGNANYYALEWQRTAEHWEAGDTFERTEEFQAVAAVLSEIKSLCLDRKIRLIVLYAPDKPHVVLPVARASLLPKQIRAYLALKMKDLPGPDECLNTLIDRVSVRESAVASFCRVESIEFYSLTQAMQQGIAAGQQLYFTYDQHWTPEGQRFAAEAISALFVEREREEGSIMQGKSLGSVAGQGYLEIPTNPVPTGSRPQRKGSDSERRVPG